LLSISVTSSLPFSNYLSFFPKNSLRSSTKSL
jgi:hypothetical protein